MNQFDQIICEGLACQCEIGVRESEKGIKQRLLIDFEASVPVVEKDSEEAIQLDYSVVVPEITTLIENRRFQLIETVGEAVADYLLQQPHVQSVKVKVKKFPMDLKNISSVSYICQRSK